MVYQPLWVAFTALVITVHVLAIEAAPLNPTEDDFTHEAFLDEYGRYKLFWKFDSEKIVFEVHVQTTGYVGFGFSPNGGMTGSDIVIGWVKSNGKKRFTDRHALHYGEPSVDDKQDYRLLYGAEIDDHTILKFERKLDTCDDAQDWIITGDTVRLIWAYHPDDPEDDKPLPWHGRERRGSRSLYLLDEPKITDIGNDVDVQTFEILNDNVKVPSHQYTTYICHGYVLPRFNGKHQMIMYEPIIQPGNEALVHHILVYQCYGSFNESAYHGYSEECYTPNMPEDLRSCFAVVISWAIGGGPFYFPEKAGFSLGGPGDPTFVIMETHYDNPTYIDTMYDSSGIRVHYTSNIREYDATVLRTGVMVGRGTFIPPQSQSFTNIAYCSGECTEKALFNRDTNETTELHVFAGLLHSHLAGRAIRVRHVRDGLELPNVMVDMNYDFNFQELRYLREEVIIQPGDNLVVQCEYGSMDRQSPIWGGLGTQEEMCLAFFYVYPRTSLFSCQTMLLPDFMAQAIGVEIRYVEDRYPIIEKPDRFANMSLIDYMNHMNWTDEARNNLQLAYEQGMMYEECSSNLVSEDDVDTSTLYFPPTITSPLPDYNRQCDPDDANDRNDDVRDDDLISNGGDTLGYRWTPVVLSLFMLGHVVM
ncbi:DBH-like monooxygenase protein 1 [Glandiceps talaboti]